MNPDKPPEPGQIKITFPNNLPPSRHFQYVPSGHDKGSVLGPLLFALVLFVFGSLGGSGGGGGSLGNTSGQSVSVVLPPRPALPGRYAAFVRRENAHETDAIVFVYDKVTIKVVSSQAEIPVQDVDVAETYPMPPFSEDGLVRRLNVLRYWENTPLLNELHSPASGNVPHRYLKNLRNAQYIVNGDVNVEIGPLINYDHLQAQLISRHGDLKQTSIFLVDGSPRGPPSKALFTSRPPRTIYVVGRILNLRGPQQQHKSSLAARIIDLGPNDQQLDHYLAETTKWLEEVRSKASAYHVSDDLLWSPEAEQGLRLTQQERFGRGHDGTYDRPVEHPVEHPVF